MFEKRMFLNLFMKVQQNLPIQNLLGQNPTVLITAGKREENTFCHRLTPRWVRALESAENDMQIAHWENRRPVLSTAPENHSDEGKVLGDFGAKYAKYKHIKIHRNTKDNQMLVIYSWLVYERSSLYLSVTRFGTLSMTCRQVPSVIHGVPRVIYWEQHTLAITLEKIQNQSMLVVELPCLKG